MKVRLPLFMFVSVVRGRLLVKSGYKKCQNGDQIFLTVRYVCLLDTKKKKLTPLRRANKNEL